MSVSEKFFVDADCKKTYFICVANFFSEWIWL